jgi:hypothetical protein
MKRYNWQEIDSKLIGCVLGMILCIFVPFYNILAFYFIALMLSVSMRNSGYHQFFLANMVLLVSSLLSYSVDHYLDVNTYRQLFNDFTNPDFGYLDYKGEILIVVWAKFFYFLTDSTDYSYFTFNMLALAILMLFCRVLSKRFFLFLFLIILFTDIIRIAPFALRQNLSSLVLLYCAIRYRTRFTYILPLVVHLSSLIYVPLMSKHIRDFISRNSYVLIVIAIFVFLFLRIDLLAYLGHFLEASIGTAWKFRYYIGLAQQESNLYVSLPNKLLSLYSLVLLARLSKYREFRFVNSEIVLIFYYSCFLFFATSNIPAIPSRLGFIYLMYMPVFIIFFI